MPKKYFRPGRRPWAKSGYSWPLTGKARPAGTVQKHSERAWLPHERGLQHCVRTPF